MTNQSSLDPKSEHISLGHTPEIPEITSGVNLTLSLPQSPDIVEQSSEATPKMPSIRVALTVPDIEDVTYGRIAFR